MKTKTKTITVTYPHIVLGLPEKGGPYYLITKVTDTIEHTPGKYLSRTQVSELCDAKGWKVTIVPAQARS